MTNDALIPFWGSVAEWATVAAALIAFAVSVFALRIARSSERQQQFMRIHELLTGPDSQKGRRLLHAHFREGPNFSKLQRRRPDDIDLINRAVSLFNTLAIYADRGYIPEEVALAHWAPTIKGAWRPIEAYLLWRRQADPTLWTPLVDFAEKCGADVSRSR